MRKSLTKRERLSGYGNFERLFANARFVEVKGLKLLFVENEMQWNRIAIIAKKNLGNSVMRNRIKRHIRESYRNIKSKLAIGFDLLFIPYKGEYDYFDRLSQVLLVLERAGVIK